MGSAYELDANGGLRAVVGKVDNRGAVSGFRRCEAELVFESPDRCLLIEVALTPLQRNNNSFYESFPFRTAFLR